LTRDVLRIDKSRFNSRFNHVSHVPIVFRVKLGKTGKSLRITVPKPITEGFEWKEGDEIELVVTEQHIVLKRSKAASPRETARGQLEAG